MENGNILMKIFCKNLRKILRDPFMFILIYYMLDSKYYFMLVMLILLFLLIKLISGFQKLDLKSLMNGNNGKSEIKLLDLLLSIDCHQVIVILYLLLLKELVKWLLSGKEKKLIH